MSAFPFIDFWFVRHAPVVAQKGWLYGSTDLDAEFEDTNLLKSVANRLPKTASVYTSDLKRTAQTRAALGLVNPTEIVPEIREQHFGDWENTSLSLIPADHIIWQQPHSFCPPNGEPWTAVRERAVSWMKNLKPMHQDVIVVAHAGSIRGMLAEVLNLSDEKALALGLDNLSVSQARWFPESHAWRLAYTNWTP